MTEHSSQKPLSSEYVKESYDAFLSGNSEEYGYYRWFRTAVSRFHYAQSRRAFLSVVRTRSYGKAFEVGGGDGVWTELLMPHADSLDFLDISTQMISRAQRRLESFAPRINFICADFMNNTLESSRYDAVLSFRNFEYFPDQSKAMQEFARILKPGGEIILVTKSPEYDWKGYFQNKRLHSGQMSIQDLRALFEKNGFVILRILPAILGKKISWPPVRWVFHGLQWLIIQLPQFLVPVSILKYWSESFLIHAIKNPR